MSTLLEFTLPRLKNLSCSANKPRVFFQDTIQPALLLQVTRAGTKTYYGRGYNKAKDYTQKVPIGKLKQTELRYARKRAREIATLLAQGIDPNEEKKKLRQDITFGEAYESYMTDPVNRRKKGPKREATLEGYESLNRCHVGPKFASKKLSSISNAEIDDFHTSIGKHVGKPTANRAKTLVSGVFNDAIKRGWVGANPAFGIEDFPEQARKRFLDEHEIGPFIKACHVERENGSTVIADAVLLALFTGMRRRNICAAAWHEFDLERGVWSVPGEKMKNREPQVAYLSSYIKKIILRRYKYRTCDKWVFPGKGKTGHLVEPKNGILRIAERAKIDTEGVQLHCMKHTFTTYADDLGGVPTGIRKRLACHKGKNDATDRYTHSIERRVRIFYARVARRMLKNVKES